MTTPYQAARTAISALYNGATPNGIHDDELGEWAACYRDLCMAHEADGTRGVQRAFEVIARADKRLYALIAGDEATEPIAPVGPALISASDLMRTVFQPVKWIVPDILPEGVTIFAGKPKMGKSWLALNLALAVAAGGRALGHIQVEQGNVLYLALEDNKRRLHSRMSKLLQNGTVPEGLDLALDWPRLTDDTLGLTWLMGWIEAHPNARLIVIDTLAKVRPPMGKSSSVYEHDYNTVQGLKTLSDRYSIGILIIHHVRKGTSDDPLELISGSFGLSGGVDGAIVLARDRGAADAVLHITGRDVEEKELAMTWAADLALWSIAGDADEYRMSKERRTVLDTLQGVRDGLSPKELAEALQKPHGAVKKMLRDMLDAGQVRQSAYGRYISIH